MSKNYAFQTISQLSTLIRDKKVSPVTLVEECLARIEKLQPELNAFITVTKDEALAEAKQAEADIKAGKWRGPLHGIPVALKDMYDTAGIKTTAAFEHFKDRVPQKDAVAVTKLKDAGAIIMGKTNMHTLAMGTTSAQSFFGPVHNSWDTEYIAGGSSGGSAVAIAAGLCFATIDTDAIGSVRLPASCNGVVGFKCTWGLIDNSGILADQPADPTILALATVGITTRDPSDTALVLEALTDKKFAHKGQKPDVKQIGVVTNFGSDTSVRKGFEAAVNVIRKLGYQLVDVEAPFSENPDMQHIEENRKTANTELFKDIDVMILPTTAAVVPKIDTVGENPQALSPQNTFFANYFALPAISIPCGFDEHGLPLGLQIVGKQNGDADVLRVAQAFQQVAPWSDRHPDL